MKTGYIQLEKIVQQLKQVLLTTVIIRLSSMLSRHNRHTAFSQCYETVYLSAGLFVTK